MGNYVIKVRGEAGPTVRAAFDDFEITVEENTTLFRGAITDRAALYGVLQRLQDLGIEILEVRQEGPGNEEVTTAPSHEG